MLGGSGRSLHRRSRKPGSAAIRNDDAVSARTIGGANERAKIVWILDAVDHNDKAELAVAILQQSIDVGILLAGGNRDDALMHVGVGNAIELLARKEADLHAAGAAI